jgi:hypothetical protein
MPYCILPLQVKDTGEKKSLIHDMSKLNDYVQKNSFKLESWPEMLDYAKNSGFSIKFDLKKFYHEIKLADQDIKYYGFRYVMSEGKSPTNFVWKTLPYGYTRAPYIAKAIIKPLVAKWRRLGASVVVFYDDGMAVSDDPVFLKHI